jgi:predicted nuclease with TOPRIM domain
MKELNEADAMAEKEARDLVEHYHKATSDDRRAELKKKLEELTKEHFDIRQERRALEISRLEDRLKQVRAAIAKRNEARDLIVQIRVSQLLGELELDDWAAPSWRRGR